MDSVLLPNGQVESPLEDRSHLRRIYAESCSSCIRSWSGAGAVSGPSEVRTHRDRTCSRWQVCESCFCRLPIRKFLKKGHYEE